MAAIDAGQNWAHDKSDTNYIKLHVIITSSQVKANKTLALLAPTKRRNTYE